MGGGDLQMINEYAEGHRLGVFVDPTLEHQASIMNRMRSSAGAGLRLTAPNQKDATILTFALSGKGYGSPAQWERVRVRVKSQFGPRLAIPDPHFIRGS